MEFPDIGKQCSQPHCAQLDYLPHFCSCKLIFCREHFNSHAIECIYFKQNFQISNNNENTKFQCSISKCNDVSILALVCKQCNKHFCISHRHHTTCSEVSPQAIADAKEKAANTTARFQSAINNIDNEINATLANAKKKSATKKTATQVQLMRLKSRAKGEKNIPVDDRIYFEVHFKNKSETVGIKAVYISKTWSIGRAIDSMAELCAVPNKNNQQNAAKLRLFIKNTGQILSEKMSDRIDLLLDQLQIINGDTVILDYCNDENNTASHYKMF